ncbi:hypothetical protein COOONC_06757 [Cooperia oncophora]
MTLTPQHSPNVILEMKTVQRYIRHYEPKDDGKCVATSNGKYLCIQTFKMPSNCWLDDGTTVVCMKRRTEYI